MRQHLGLPAILLVLVPAVLLLALLPAAVGAAGPAAANGGGRGTLDGATPFSQFGFAVTIRSDGAVQGHVECLMAGASAVPGLQLMAVSGQVSSASVLGEAATFEGVGTLNMGRQGRIEGERFRVSVKAGGAGTGMLQLTLVEPFAMVLPAETVLNGRIDVR
jgi:hypothetical protein